MNQGITSGLALLHFSEKYRKPSLIERLNVWLELKDHIFFHKWQLAIMLGDKDMFWGSAYDHGQGD